MHMLYSDAPAYIIVMQVTYKIVFLGSHPPPPFFGFGWKQ